MVCELKVIIVDFKYNFNFGFTAVIVTAAITAILLIENTEFANAMIFMSETDEAKFARKQVFSNPKYIEVLELLIPRFANEGII
jgi:hypothetical protein